MTRRKAHQDARALRRAAARKVKGEEKPKQLPPGSQVRFLSKEAAEQKASLEKTVESAKRANAMGLVLPMPDGSWR